MLGSVYGDSKMLLGCPTRVLRTRRFCAGSEIEHELDSQDLGSIMIVENERNVMKFSQPSILDGLIYIMNLHRLEPEPP